MIELDVDIQNRAVFICDIFVDKTVLLFYINKTERINKERGNCIMEVKHIYRGFKILNIILALLISIFASYCTQEKEQNIKRTGLDKSTGDFNSQQQTEKIKSAKGKKLATLKEVVNATDMDIDGEELYVLDEVVVYVYSLKDYRLLRKFGRKGNGPGEMVYHRVTVVMMEIFQNNVYLYRMNKLAIYKKDGKVKGEKIFRFYLMQVVPLGNGLFIVRIRLANQYVTGDEKFGTLTLLLFDPELTKSKEIFQKNFPAEDSEKDGYQIFRPTRNWIVRNSDKQLFLFDSGKGSHISTFDVEGRPLDPIFLDLPKVIITEKFKSDVLSWIKGDPYLKDITEEWNLKIVFPEYFPLMRNFTVKNNRIYCQTYIKKNNKSLFYIFNLKGECLKKIFLPSSERELIRYGTNKIYDFTHNKYYYLYDNEEEETWELFCADIKPAL